MMGYGGWGMGGGMGFGMILFWILLILAIVWLVRALDMGRTFPGRDADRSADRTPDTPREDRALSILRERYARGEIDSDEFERRRRDLVRKETE